MKSFGSLLDKLGSYYCEMLTPETNGSFYGFKKVGENFVFTKSNGKLVSKSGIQKDLIGKTLYEVLPFEEAQAKNRFYQKAWNGEPVAYRSTTSSGIDYLIYLAPQIQNNQILEVYAYGINICNWSNFKSAYITLQDLNGETRYLSNNIRKLGFDIDDFINKKIMNHPNDKDRIVKTRNVIIRTKKAHHISTKLIFQGLEYLLLTVGVPIIYSDKVVCILTFSEVIL